MAPVRVPLLAPVTCDDFATSSIGRGICLNPNFLGLQMRMRIDLKLRWLTSKYPLDFSFCIHLFIVRIAYPVSCWILL